MKKAKKKTKWFTVILLYPDYATGDFGADISVRWVRVEAGKDELSLAATAAREQCIKDNASGEFGDPPGSDLRAIAVLEGRRKIVADATDGL